MKISSTTKIVLLINSKYGWRKHKSRIYQYELMSKKNKKVSTILSNIEHFLVLVYAINKCVSILLLLL